MDYHLQELERKSIYIIREARTKFRQVAALWTTGKDSTSLLFLCQKAFFGKMPFPVIHLDKGHDFPETGQFRDDLVKELGLNLIIGEITEGLNKVNALKEILEKYKFDALLISARRDSYKIRAEEPYFSPRDKDLHWDFKNQPPKIFNSISDFKGASHVRVHPLLDWRELDVWQYIKERNIPVNPLYFAKNGQRHRDISYPGASSAVESNAQTVDNIIEELKITQVSEQSGGFKDAEKEEVMRRLRQLGYI